MLFPRAVFRLVEYFFIYLAFSATFLVSFSLDVKKSGKFEFFMHFTALHSDKPRDNTESKFNINLGYFDSLTSWDL